MAAQRDAPVGAATQKWGSRTTVSSPTARVLRSDLEAGETGDGDPRILKHLRDTQLVVFRVVLLEQGHLLEERAQAPLDDLREGGLGLALVAGDLGHDLALLLDVGGRYLVTRQVLGVGE